MNAPIVAGALGVNMAEYVLGGSPMGKEMDARLRGLKPPFHNRGMVSSPIVLFVPPDEIPQK